MSTAVASDEVNQYAQPVSKDAELTKRLLETIEQPAGSDATSTELANFLGKLADHQFDLFAAIAGPLDDN